MEPRPTLSRWSPYCVTHLHIFTGAPAIHMDRASATDDAEFRLCVQRKEPRQQALPLPPPDPASRRPPRPHPLRPAVATHRHRAPEVPELPMLAPPRASGRRTSGETRAHIGAARRLPLRDKHPSRGSTPTRRRCGRTRYCVLHHSCSPVLLSAASCTELALCAERRACASQPQAPPCSQPRDLCLAPWQERPQGFFSQAGC
eukprot:scaffold5571_cov142-Isochrysis_galbana.AAC.7